MTVSYTFKELLNKEILQKYNDNHDPRTGKFAPKGGGAAGSSESPKRTMTITTIRGETKTVTGAGEYQYGDRKGERWDDERWDSWKRTQEADIINAKNTHEAIESLKYMYAPDQKGTANSDNFMYNTVAMFESMKGRHKRKPDYVSYNRDGKVSS